MLGASQWSMPLEIAPILSAAGLHVDSTPPEKIVDVMATVRLIQETVNKFKAANVDSTEYACLKAIVLFKPSKCSVMSFHRSLCSVRHPQGGVYSTNIWV